MNIIERAQNHYLRRQRSKVWEYSCIILFAIGVFAAIFPLLDYVSHSIFYFAPLVYLICFVGILRTLFITANTGDWFKDWDLLILSGVSAHRMIYGMWLSVVRNTAKYHFAFGILRVGVALKMALFLNQLPIDFCYRVYKLSPFCDPNMTFDISANLFMRTLIGIAILAFYSLFEVGLYAAIGLLAVIFTRRQTHAVKSGMALMMAAITIGLFSGCWFGVHQFYDWVIAQGSCNEGTACAVYVTGGGTDTYTFTADYRNTRHFVAITLAGISTTLDGGMMVTASALRPSRSPLSNVLESLSFIVAGFIFYIILIRLILLLATREVMRNGALS